jgi:hypothetical protein
VTFWLRLTLCAALAARGEGLRGLGCHPYVAGRSGAVYRVAACVTIVGGAEPALDRAGLGSRFVDEERVNVHRGIPAWSSRSAGSSARRSWPSVVASSYSTQLNSCKR